MEEFEKEIRKIFLEEAKQLLEDVEECFFRLEKEPENPDVVERIFRLAHSLKGSSGGVGYQDIMEFTHHFENVLVRLKKREIQVTPSLVDFLLRAKDALNESVALKLSDIAATSDFGALTAETALHLNGTSQSSSSSAVTAMSPFASAKAGDIVFADDFPADTGGPSVEGESPSNLRLVASHGGSSVGRAEARVQNSSQSTKAGKPPEESMRVAPSRIDRIINSIGELVILQSVLEQNRDQVTSPLLVKTIGQLGKLLREIQGNAMELRMVPLKPTFQRLQRIVRDTARALGKDVQVDVVGEDAEVDRTVHERLTDPLVHMVRNAVDHGLELPDDRVRAGKPVVGTVTISAENRGDRLIILIRDDGKGLNPELVWKKAIEKGLLPADARYSPEAATQLIFLPGFSTKPAVTELSGRGVGMDVVKTNLEALGGQVRITSELGKGSCFEITLPLSLGVIEGMIVTTSCERYIVPLTQVQETTRITAESITQFEAAQEMLTLRGTTMRLHRLSNLLAAGRAPRKGPPGKPAGAPTEAIAIILKRNDDSLHAIAVDDIVSQQQVVIKRLDAKLAQLGAFTGGTILGDGKAALLLDLKELTNGIGA